MNKTIYNQSDKVNPFEGEKIKIKIMTFTNHSRLYVITYCDLEYAYDSISDFRQDTHNWFYRNLSGDQYQDMISAMNPYAYA